MSTATHIPAASTARALPRATCNGSGLITFATEDGPEHYACHGCTSCVTAAAPVARTALASTAALAGCLNDDSPF